MAKRYCIDYDPRTRQHVICWCDRGRLVCVDLPDEIVEKSRAEIDRVPLCTKDFCKGDEHGSRVGFPS